MKANSNCKEAEAWHFLCIEKTISRHHDVERFWCPFLKMKPLGYISAILYYHFFSVNNRDDDNPKNQLVKILVVEEVYLDIFCSIWYHSMICWICCINGWGTIIGCHGWQWFASLPVKKWEKYIDLGMSIAS